MELIGNKIKRLIKEKGYTKVNNFHKKIKELYGARAFARFTLTRILENRVNVREATLQQIATALLVKASTIREGTNAENLEEMPEEKSYTYSGGSELQILEKDLPFVIKQLTLRNDTFMFTADEFIANDVPLGMESLDKFPSSALLGAIEKAGITMPNKDKVRGDLYKLNCILKMKNLHNKFPKLKLPHDATNLIKREKLSKKDLIQLNRHILESAFPHQCPKIPKNRLCTDIEQDDPKATESLKWIIVMKGKINVYITGSGGETKKTLAEGQRLSFDARQPHYFENLSMKISRVLIIHYPAANNIFR